MVATIDIKKDGTKGVLHTSKQCGLPQQTLSDRVKGKVIHGSNLGPEPFLTAVEEKELSL